MSVAKEQLQDLSADAVAGKGLSGRSHLRKDFASHGKSQINAGPSLSKCGKVASSLAPRRVSPARSSLNQDASHHRTSHSCRVQWANAEITTTATTTTPPTRTKPRTLRVRRSILKKKSRSPRRSPVHVLRAQGCVDTMYWTMFMADTAV